jgi:hypothetical protein
MLSYGPPLNKNKKWCMVLERVWESSTRLQIKKAQLQIFSAKHNQLQQLHRGYALEKKVEQTPNSMVFKECLKRYSTKSKFPRVG